MSMHGGIRYSHYAVSLAYHVIAMWFIKCRQPFKRGFVHYIVKVCFYHCAFICLYSMLCQWLHEQCHSANVLNV